MEINNDLISRQAAIDNLNFGAEFLRRALDVIDLVGAEREKFAWGLGLIESCISDMKDLPPTQAERKEAVWRHEPRKKSWIFYCSACGATAYWPQNNRTDTPARCQYKICPSCGAEMEASE